jgi:hypothetical protein
MIVNIDCETPLAVGHLLSFALSYVVAVDIMMIAIGYQDPYSSLHVGYLTKIIFSISQSFQCTIKMTLVFHSVSQRLLI